MRREGQGRGNTGGDKGSEEDGGGGGRARDYEVQYRDLIPAPVDRTPVMVPVVITPQMDNMSKISQ